MTSNDENETLSARKLINETKFINSSLSTLETVIHSLSTGQAFTSYRSSVLTKLLKSTLTKGRTSLLILVAPAHEMETLKSLKFGMRCGSLKTNKACSKAQDPLLALLEAGSQEEALFLVKQMVELKDRREVEREELMRMLGVDNVDESMQHQVMTHKVSGLNRGI